MSIGANAREQVKGYVERIERLDDEIDGLKSDRRDLLKEAADAGFNAKALAAVVKRRREDEAKREKRQAFESDLDLYLFHLGMTPLEQAIEKAGPAPDIAPIPVADASRPFANDGLPDIPPEFDRRGEKAGAA